jgi:hypothetical protein
MGSVIGVDGRFDSSSDVFRYDVVATPFDISASKTSYLKEFSKNRYFFYFGTTDKLDRFKKEAFFVLFLKTDLFYVASNRVKLWYILV